MNNKSASPITWEKYVMLDYVEGDDIEQHTRRVEGSAVAALIRLYEERRDAEKRLQRISAEILWYERVMPQRLIQRVVKYSTP